MTNDQKIVSVSERVRRDMKKAGETQISLSSCLDISQGYLNDLLGGRKKWTPEILDRVAKKFEWSETKYRRLTRQAARESGWPY